MATEDEILKFGVEVDPRDAIAGFHKAQKAISEHLRRIDKESQRISKTSGKAWQKLGEEMRGAYRDAVSSAIDSQKNLGSEIARIGESQRKVQEKYKRGLEKRADLERKIRGYRKQEDKIGKVITQTDRKDKDALEMGRAIQAKITQDRKADEKILQNLNTGLREQQNIFGKLDSEASKYKRTMEEAEKSAADMKEKLEESAYQESEARPARIAQSISDGGELLTAPLKALLNNDLPAAAGAAAKIIGKGMLAGMHLLRKRTEKPEVPGAGAGKAMKMAEGGMGKIVSGFTKMGPVLTALGGQLSVAFDIITKLDSRIKQFNASLLEASDTSAYLASHAGNVNAAFADVHTTIKKVRDAAHDLDNMDLGITPEMYTSTISGLAAEGLGLKQIGDAAKKANMPVEALSKQLVQSSVVFSRGLGVSIGEVNQLMSHMTTDMGIDADKTQLKLQAITNAANNSGMASNKFFNILRGMSDDMTLYNNRLEDTTRLLKMLGKAMDPKQVQKFAQSLVGMTKDKDLSERLKLTIMAGTPKAAAIGMKDSDRKLTEMAGDLKLSAAETKEMLDAVHKSPEETSKWQIKMATRMGNKFNASQRSDINRAALRTQQLASGDAVDTASAMADNSWKANFDLMDAAIKNITHGTSIKDLKGAQLLAAGQAAGLSDEQVLMAKETYMSLDQTKGEIVAKLQTNAELTKEEQGILKGLHINSTDADAASQLQAKDSNAIMETMSKVTQNEAKGIKDQYVLQKKIGNDIVSIEAKVGIIAGSLTNWVGEFVDKLAYAITNPILQMINGLIDIIQKLSKKLFKGAIGKFFGFGDEKKPEQPEAAKEPEKPGYWAAAKNLVGAGGEDDVNAPTFTGAIENFLGLGDEPAAQGTESAAAPEPEAESAATPPKPASAAPAVNPAPTEVQGPALDSIRKGMDEVRQATKDTGIAEVTQTIRDQSEMTLTDGFGVLAGILKRDVKLDKSFLANELGPVIEKSVLDAIRVALVEYSLYKDMSAGAITSALNKQGGDAKSFVAGKVEAAKPHAAGGFVAGQNPDGTAKVLKAPAGEMPTTIGKGETIVPKGGAGGGGTSVTVNVNGIGGSDLANMVKVAATNAIYEYKRREHLN